MTNFGRKDWRLKIGVRSFGAGAEGSMEWRELELPPGEEVSHLIANRDPLPTEFLYENIVTAVEAKRWASDGVVFLRYGPVYQFPEGFDLWEQRYLDLRFYILNAASSEWSDLTVTLSYPEGWLGQDREPQYWLEPERLIPGKAIVRLGSLRPQQYRVAPFRLKGPHTYDTEYLTRNKSKHYPSEYGPGVRLPTRETGTRLEASFEAVLRGRKSDGSLIERRLFVPVEIIPIEEE